MSESGTQETPLNQQTVHPTQAPSPEPVAHFDQANVASVDARRRESRVSMLDFAEVRGTREEDGSRWDGETLQGNLALCKQHYESMVHYVTMDRQEMIAMAQASLSRAEVIRNTLDHIHPTKRYQLQEVIAEQEAKAVEMQQMVTQYDGLLESERTRLNERMLYLLHSASGGEVNTAVQNLQWPAHAVCQDLNLAQDYFLMSTGRYFPTVTLQRNQQGEQQLVDTETDSECEELKRLRQQIMMLENTLARATMDKSATKEQDKNTTRREEKPAKDITKIYVERRKRHKFATFEKGSAFEAEQWLQRYEVLAQYLGFTDEEKSEELVGVLTGAALDWFIGLEPEIARTWEKVKQEFLRQHALGEDPTLAAFNELKTFKQGNRPMKVFGPELKTLLQRAGLFLPNIQLDYLKDKLKPELERAVIMARVTNLDDGIRVATDIERSMGNKQDATYMGPIKTELPPAKYEETPEVLQNYQQHQGNQKKVKKFEKKQGKRKETRECYKCHKIGHIAKDCWSKDKKQNTQHIKEEEENVFAHLMVNNSQVDVSFKLGSRFKVEVQMKEEQFKRKVLVDTGSTISSITQAVVEELRLETIPTQKIAISYGNNSHQYSAKKAIMDFTFNSNEKSKAFVYVVEKQNEDIILGMDWLEKEDIIIHTKSKTISKQQKAVEMTNSTATVVDKMLEQYPNLTSEDLTQNKTTAPYKHSINTGGAKPVVARDFRRSPAENAAIAEEVKVMLAKGVIVPSQSDWCSPVILIKKPDGTFRFCVDYRKLNQVVIKDEFPLPLIPDLLEKLRGYKYFTSMDLKSGFWQLPLNSEDGSSKRTAFQANGSLYEFTSLPYGISTGPSSFARLMSIVLKGLPRTCNFCDDILIHSRTYEEHVEDVQRVLERLNEYNLKITSKKCQWFQAEVKFLGFLVNGEGIRSNPDKVAVVKDWKTPQNKKALSRFLGFANFYHKFINNLSGKARPLYQLIKGEQPFVWGQKEQAAFRDIKQALMTLPGLVYPNPNWPYDLHCDGSNTGIGACLVQNSRPIAFASKTLSSAEQNYSTTEKECLAIVWALQHFHPYIYGATLNIYTDHIALKSILGTRLPRGRIARWIVALQEYHPYTIIHKKGILNTDADALSRLDQNNQTADIDIGSLTAKDILNLQKVDAKISVMLKEGIQKPFKWVNEMVFYQDENKLIPVIPLALIERVLNHAHNQGGHFGVDKTVARVKNIGWWDTREEDVKMWIKYCENCQVYKIRNDNNKPPLKPITATRVGQIWATDIATLTTSKHGNKYVIVIMEYLSKWAVTCALDSFDTDMIAQVLLYEVILKYGLPERIISDNGASYVSDAMTIVLQRLGISRALTSVEHPQSDGLVERFNRTLKTSIAIVAGQEPNAWCEYLPFITFAYNTAEQASTKLTPFKIMHGREAVLPLFPSVKVEDQDKDSVYKWGKFLNRTVPLIHSKAIANIKKAQEYQQEQYQGSKRIQTNYNPGDLVARRNVKLGGFPKKRWIGPWVIIRATNKDNTAYQIYNKKNPTSGSKANISDLRRWYSR